MDSTRANLKQQQIALLAALLGQGVVPAGFDAGKVYACRDSLAAKRNRSAMRAWPRLFASLGGRGAALFAEFAMRVDLPATGGPLADGHAFAVWLAQRGELAWDAQLELLHVAMYWVRTRRGLRPRRGFWIGGRGTIRPPQLAIGWRLPWLGGRWWFLGRP